MPCEQLRSDSKRQRSAFTLLELLIVIAIIDIGRFAYTALSRVTLLPWGYSRVCRLPRA